MTKESLDFLSEKVAKARYLADKVNEAESAIDLINVICNKFSNGDDFFVGTKSSARLVVPRDAVPEIVSIVRRSLYDNRDKTEDAFLKFD